MACLTFVGLGGVAIAKGDDDVLSMGVPAALIFGLGILVALIQIARPSVMTITAEGVSVRTILKTWSVRWVEVGDFFVFQTRGINQSTGLTFSGTEMAAFNWAGAPERPARRGRLLRAAGADGGLGPGWPLSARQMADLLNAARARALEAARARKLEPALATSGEEITKK
jgi:hypothetical protein